MTNIEIRELIAALEQIASSKVYSYGITQKARWKAVELERQLVPEEPEAVGIDKWFKTK